MGKHLEIVGEVKERLRPTKLQVRVLGLFYGMLKSVLEECLGDSLDYSVELVGSAAKGTMLSDKWEIDVFILIDRPRKWILENGDKLLEHCLNGRLPFYFKYSQHPYAAISLMGLEADIVPCPSKPGPGEHTGVERTPLHTRYVKEALSSKPWLADEVRLLKSFMKGIGVYGAEARIGGFSGYLAELLVINYGSFIKVLEEASEWRPPVVIDMGLGGDVVARLSQRYSGSPMVVPDPTDPGRNVAAAVTVRRLSEFILASKLFLEKPEKSFFHIYQPGPGGLSKPMPGVAVIYKGAFYENPPDAVWGRIKRSGERLYSALKSRGFPVASYTFYTDEATIAAVYVHMLSTKPYPIEFRRGPYPWDKERPHRFAEKRLAEHGWVWVASSGSLEGARPRASSLVREVEAIVGSIPQPPGTNFVEVFECTGAEPCLPMERLESMRDPTPLWIRLALGGGTD